MVEKIGKVTLDFSDYSGEDLYSDGEVEDELLQVVKDFPEAAFQKIIEEKRSWPFLYHLSVQRQNIIEWLPLEGSKVLEVGSGCGAITGMLAKKAKSVTGVDLSAKRSRINACRNSDFENLTIRVGNFKDIEPKLEDDFDFILLIGVFEYAHAYMGGDHPYEDFLKILKKHMKSDARLVIAIENKYGLKYFAGCTEDHLGTYFSGIENYAEGGNVRTFGRKGLEQMLERAGLSEYQFYYPYPDYKFMTTLYSDGHLPRKGELSDNLRNFDRDRMLLFDEKNAFDGILEEGLFDVFSNSYLVVAGDAFNTEYVRYSNDRAREYCIKTEIICGRNGERTVAKKPLSNDSYDHVEKMKESYDKLAQKYKGGKLDINVCRLHKYEGVPSAEFEYVEGRLLSELLDECLEAEDYEKFHALFNEYLLRIGYHSEEEVADYDPVFSNILVDGDRWTLIDYEWTYDRKVELKELAFRAIYCYILESGKREKFDFSKIMEEIGVTEEEAEDFREKERKFQEYVTGRRKAMGQIRELIGHKANIPQKWIDRYEESAALNRVQIYEDTGSGFSEEESYFVKDAFKGENLIEFDTCVSGNVRRLRIDPAFYSCIVKIQELTLNGVRIPLEKKKVFQANGKVSKPGRKIEYCPAVCFGTDDPNLYIDLRGLERQGENLISVKMEIIKLTGEMAEDLCKI